MLVEAVAVQTAAQHVRLFLFDANRTELVLAADFPRDYTGAPTLDDSRTGHRRWGRPLRTVAERNMGIIGYSPTETERSGTATTKRGAAGSAAAGDRLATIRHAIGGGSEGGDGQHGDYGDDGDEDGADGVDYDAVYSGDGTPLRNAAKVKCYMCWPVRAHGAPSVVKGVLEVVNKRETLQSASQRRFSAADEGIIHHAALALSAALARYPHLSDSAVLDAAKAGAAAPRLLAALQASNGTPAAHVPDAPYRDKGGPFGAVRSAEAIVNRALTTALALPVFRGAMHSIRTSPGTVESVAAMASVPANAALLGTEEAHRPRSLPHLPATDSATVDYRLEPPSQLTRLDYTLEALSAMWRREHEENRSMHEQSRYWSGRVRALTDLSRCFSEAIGKARGMRSLEEVQTYLRSLDLSARTGNVPAFLGTVLEGVKRDGGGGGTLTVAAVGEGSGSDAPTDGADCDGATSPTTAHLRGSGGPFAETLAVAKARRIAAVDEGPTDVRSFTIDPSAKRQQQADIAAFVEQQTTLGDAIRRKEREAAAGARYTRGTALSAAKSEGPRRPSWLIEQRHEAFEEKRRAERESRVGVPPIPTAVDGAAAASSSSSRRSQSARGVPANKPAPSPLVLPDGRLFLPAPPRSPRR